MCPSEEGGQPRNDVRVLLCYREMILCAIYYATLLLRRRAHLGVQPQQDVVGRAPPKAGRGYGAEAHDEGHAHQQHHARDGTVARRLGSSK